MAGAMALCIYGTGHGRAGFASSRRLGEEVRSYEVPLDGNFITKPKSNGIFGGRLS